MKEHKHKNKNTKAVAGAIFLFGGRPRFANERERRAKTTIQYIMKTNQNYFFIYLIIMTFTISCSSKQEHLINSLINLNEQAEKNLWFTEQKIISQETKNELSKKIVNKSEQTIELIKKYKSELYKLNCGDCNRVFNLISPLDSKIANKYFFDSNKRAYKLKQQIDEYVSFLIYNISDDSIKTIIQRRLDLYDYQSTDGTIYPWESWNFEFIPIINCFTYLTSLEFEIREIEYDIVNYIENTNHKTNIEY